MLTNPFPQQGYITAQPTQGQASQPAPPPSQRDYQILMMNSDEVIIEQVNLQT